MSKQIDQLSRSVISSTLDRIRPLITREEAVCIGRRIYDDGPPTEDRLFVVAQFVQVLSPGEVLDNYISYIQNT